MTTKTFKVQIPIIITSDTEHSRLFDRFLSIDVEAKTNKEALSKLESKLLAMMKEEKGQAS